VLTPPPVQFDRGYLNAFWGQFCSPPLERKPQRAPTQKWRYFKHVVLANTKSEARARLKEFREVGSLPVGAGSAIVREGSSVPKGSCEGETS
jgi:hypothetical protein